MAVFVATTAKRTSVAAKVDAALKPNQPNSRMNVAEHRHRDVVTRQRARLAVLVRTCRCEDRARARRPVPRRRRPRAPRRSRRSRRSRGRASSGVAELGEPAAAPGPGAEQRVVDGAAEEAPPDERLPLPPLGHRAGRDGRHRVHERHHVEEERHATGGVEGLAGAGPAALPQEHPVARAEEVRADRAVRSRSAAASTRRTSGRSRRGSRRRSRGRRWRSSSTPRAPRAWPGRSRSRPARSRPA